MSGKHIVIVGGGTAGWMAANLFVQKWSGERVSVTPVESPGSGIDSYRHPFFTQPDTFTQSSFMTNCQTRRLGLDVHTQPDEFFLNGALARQGKGPRAPMNLSDSLRHVLDVWYRSGDLTRENLAAR